MSFVKKIWKDRISQFPNRRTINDGYVTKQVTVGRDEGVVTEEGTPFDATEMNDLENRIYAAIEQGGGGGGGAGTYDYTELFNKPRINNHELNGNKSLGDLGIASNANELPIESGSATTTKGYIDSLIAEKLTDLNTPLTTGTATPKISYYASTASNKPSGNDGVTITQGNGTYRQQMAFDLEGNTFARYYNNGTISSWRRIAGSSENVRNQITFNETITATNTQAWLKDGNLIIYYQGEYKTHNANDVLFTLPTKLRPTVSCYCPCVINEQAFGDIEIATTGVAKLNQLSTAGAQGRVYFHCVIPLF